MVTSVSTLLCQVSDMDRAVAFYRDVLGLKPGYTSPHWSDFKIGDIKIGLHPPFDGSSAPYSVRNKGWKIGLEVSDLAEFREKLKVAGVWTAAEYHDIPGGVILDFEDPDGNAMQAMQFGASAKDLAR